MMLPITLAQLAKIMPKAGPAAALYLPWLNAALVEFGITTEKSIEAFLAQIAVETGDLRTVSENLNYSAQGLADTWPNRYGLKSLQGALVRDPLTRKVKPSPKALALHRNPEAIANDCYANRMGNGDEASGDGWRHRGAGAFQTTGKTNQYRVALHFDIDPEQIGDWLRTPEGAMRSAALFWHDNGLGALAEAGQFKAVCRGVNGGDTGIDERLAAWGIAQRVIA